MNVEKIEFKVARAKSRAIELYHRDSPFKHRAEKSRVKYSRKMKTPQGD